ncbi:MAG: sensor histidine kinase, partial [Bacteroidota bacterium]
LLWKNYRDKKKSAAELQVKNNIISTALREKEILLKEIHHRVKNNLQFISSLLGLQTEHITDQRALGALEEGQNRVQSMALIHQNLYQEDNLTGVDMHDYFVKLIRGLFDSYNIRPNQVKLDLHIQDINLDVDSVIPIGLIVNELVSNSLKYAFPTGEEGTIGVSLSMKDDKLLVEVSDNGVGISDEAIEGLGESFGHRLINVFMEQLDGDMNISNDAGTTVRLLIRNYKLAS